MRILVIGLGVQGKKRVKFAGTDVVATVDPKNKTANFRYLEEVPINSFDVGIICTPEKEKLGLINYLLKDIKKKLI